MDSKPLRILVLGAPNVGTTRFSFTFGFDGPVDPLPGVAEKFDRLMTIDNSSVRVNLWDIAGTYFEKSLEECAAQLSNQPSSSHDPTPQSDCLPYMWQSGLEGSYIGSDAAILVFSLISPPSAQVLRNLYPELIDLVPTIPIFLVGTHVDLRHDPSTLDRVLSLHGRGTISTEETILLASELGARQHFEISSLEKAEVDAVVEAAVRASLVTQTPNRRAKGEKCIVM